MNSKLTYLEVQTSVIRTENTKIKLVKIGQTHTTAEKVLQSYCLAGRNCEKKRCHFELSYTYLYI